MMLRLLLIEDHLSLITGLRADLEGSHEDSVEEITILDRAPTTIEDGIAFFEGVARHGPHALRRLPVDGILIDGFLPRDGSAKYAEFGGVEAAIRISAIYDHAGIAPEDRPRLILTTAAPDDCDVRAFVAFGGDDVIPKTSLPAEELRRRIAAIVRDGERWTPPPAQLPRGYAPSFGRYLRGLEVGTGTAQVAVAINAAPGAVSRVKNELRHVFDLPPRASDREIVEAAKAAGITWIPLAHEAVARQYGVRPRLPAW
jgi:CheY-like chemotaxis protein